MELEVPMVGVTLSIKAHPKASSLNKGDLNPA